MSELKKRPGKKKRFPFSEIAKRISGLSTPVFGVSWNPPEDKRNIVRRLVAFLEDRRVLYNEYCMEYGPWVEQSVIEIRRELTDILSGCPEDLQLTGPLRAMRAACRKFLDDAGHPEMRKVVIYPRDAGIWYSLGEMRGIFGLHLAQLCTAYGVDVEPELETIFPRIDEQDILESEGECKR